MNSDEEKDFYNKIGKTIGWDFSNMKYNVIDNSQFKYFDEVNNKISKESILLDIGTGGGEKLINLISNKCLIKIGTDFSNEMIAIARKNAKKYNNKIKFFEMNSNNLIFPNEFFDIVCARHTPFNLNEILRVLNKNGLFYSEQIDEDDCMTLKEVFGRGQGYKANIKLKEKIKAEIDKKKCKEIKFYDIIQNEYYKTEEDLLFLLNNTPIIPDFGKNKDDYKNFHKYVEKNKSKNGIYLSRKLFGIKIIK